MATVTISKKEYDNLRKSSFELQALNSAGVDNWEWYGEHFEEYNRLLKEAGYEVDED